MKAGKLLKQFVVVLCTIAIITFCPFTTRADAAVTSFITGCQYDGYALLQDGTVWAWGDGYYDGQGDGAHPDSWVPVQISGLSNVTAIAGTYGCNGYALKQDGTVWAWGYNAEGQLGNGTNIKSNTPVQVSNLTNITAIAAGQSDGYALAQDGSVWAWGPNSLGQLGDGTNTNSNVPVQVSVLTNVKAIAGGSLNGYALKRDGTVWAWGANYLGQLGNGPNADSNVPVQVSNLANVIAISGGGGGGYALKQDGTVWAWGFNSVGQLGNGTSTNGEYTTGSNVPVQVSNLTNVIAIAGGQNGGYALTQDGTVWAWGANNVGQLGNDTNTSSNVPVQVSKSTGLTRAVAIAGTAFNGYAVNSDGTMWSWGDNDSGQLGNNTQEDSNVPVLVMFPAPTLEVSAAPGTANRTTEITATPGSGDTLAVCVSTSDITTPCIGGDAPTGDGIINPYTSGEDITAAAGNIVGVYELDSNGKIAAFHKITLTSDDINSTTPPAVNTVPTFISLTTDINVGKNTSANDLTSLLQVSDIDLGQTETWSQYTAPNHGTLTFNNAAASSGGTAISAPFGSLTYTPDANYTGSDSFTLQVSDGTDSATRTINVAVTQEWTDITGEGTFSYPFGMAVDNSGNVYVTDIDSGSISKKSGSTWSDITGSESFMFPCAIAVDGSGNVYAADSGNNKIKEFASGTWSDITGTESFNDPEGIAVDSSGNIYVVDSGNNKIKELPNGSDTWIDLTYAETFNYPLGIAVDSSGNIYVADWRNRKIKELPSGENSWTDLTNGETFSVPCGIAVDSSGNVYVSDAADNKIKALSDSIWSDITGTESFSSPAGIAVDGSGNVYVSDSDNNKVKEWIVNAPASDSLTSVSITGTVQVGQTLNANVMPGGATVTYQWQADNVDITGATRSTYIPSATDAGKAITVTATGTGSYSGTVTSVATTAVIVAGVSAYTVTGTIKDISSNPASGAIVKLMAGSRQVAQTASDVNGVFNISNVPSGTYNLVISKDDQIITLTIIVSDSDVAAGSVTLPNGKKNSVVDVKTGPPDIIVSNLNDFFSSSKFTTDDSDAITDGGTVQIKLTIEEKEESAATNASNIETAAGSGRAIGMFLDLTLNKTVNPVAGGTSGDTIQVNELDNVLTIEIPLPIELQGKSNYVIYRYHNAEVQTITQTAKPDGEYIVVSPDGKSITLYAKRFSTYAIAYTAASTSHTRHGGGGTAVTVPTITAYSSTGGKITISTDKKTATIVPDEGYTICDVLIDGKSVGAIAAYTFTDSANHEISAAFTEKPALPYYMQDGKKVFIGFTAMVDNILKYKAPNGVTVQFEENPKSFTDIDNHWAKANIDFVTEREIFTGTDKNIFSPQNGMTRAMFVAVIGRLYERSYGIITGNNTFSDVDVNLYYAPYVAWANKNGIIKGIGDNKFAPNTKITREQMAAIMFNFATYLGKEQSSEMINVTYPDKANISDWAMNAAAYCQLTGIITGREGGGFVPRDTATRAEVTSVIEKFVKEILK